MRERERDSPRLQRGQAAMSADMGSLLNGADTAANANSASSASVPPSFSCGFVVTTLLLLVSSLVLA